MKCFLSVPFVYDLLFHRSYVEVVGLVQRFPSWTSVVRVLIRLRIDPRFLRRFYWNIFLVVVALVLVLSVVFIAF